MGERGSSKLIGWSFDHGDMMIQSDWIWKRAAGSESRSRQPSTELRLWDLIETASDCMLVNGFFSARTSKYEKMFTS